MFRKRKFIIFSILIFAAVTFPSALRAEKWSRRYINALPDSAFASIEMRSDGKRVRHLPHHDHTGKIDPPHLWNALARVNQVKWVDPKNEVIARHHLEEHVRDYKRKAGENRERQFPIDINEAPMEELMKLPYIGEAKAGAIIDYRTRKGPFQSIEEVTKVRGIGPKIFQEIRGCITVKK
ncbi:MAG: ComEA family DNA-binding protein, partial [Thermodesulfobacteriota bacterium]